MAGHLDLSSPASPVMTSVGGGSHIGTDLNKGATVFPSHLRRTFQRFPTDYTGELVRLLDDITTVTHSIAAYVTEGTEKVSYGATSASEGLDSKVASRRLYKSLSHDGYACLILDCGFDQPLTMPADALQGSYVVMVSPLDLDPLATGGPSVCGTIFSVYKRRSPASLPGRLKDLQQNLGDQVAAGYVLYSSATKLYYTLGGEHGVYSFALHPVATQYFLQPTTALHIPLTRGIIACDRGRLLKDPIVGAAVNKYFSTREKAPAMFDTGVLSGNFNDAMLRGGIVIHFDCHMLCEAGPLALIAEQSGGKAVDGNGQRILSLSLDNETDVHKKCVLIAGTASIVDSIAAELAATSVEADA
jgi:fructose-1,6-bisphosphatase I